MLSASLILTFVLLVFTIGKSPFFRVDRAGAAIIGAMASIATGVLTFEEASAAVDHRTIVILFSMMIVVANLKAAGFFEETGRLLLRLAATQEQLLLAVVLSSGLLSAVCINDIVCLLFTPIVSSICRQTGAACRRWPCWSNQGFRGSRRSSRRSCECQNSRTGCAGFREH